MDTGLPFRIFQLSSFEPPFPAVPMVCAAEEVLSHFQSKVHE